MCGRGNSNYDGRERICSYQELDVARDIDRRPLWDLETGPFVRAMVLDQPRVRIVLAASRLVIPLTNLLLSLLTTGTSPAIRFGPVENKATTKFGENNFRGASGPVSRK